MDYVLPLEEVSVYVTEDSCTPALLHSCFTEEK